MPRARAAVSTRSSSPTLTAFQHDEAWPEQHPYLGSRLHHDVNPGFDPAPWINTYASPGKTGTHAGQHGIERHTGDRRRRCPWLSDELEARVERGDRFWVAFVELDYFKRLNDRFGYEAADQMLIKVAEHLTRMTDYICGKITAFRAHGDEFYLVGSLLSVDQEDVIRGLDHLCATIERIQLEVDQNPERMRTTVSIGWTVYPPEGGHTHTHRDLRFHLEAAVNAAKRLGRNRVVRYTDDVNKTRTRSIRDDCPRCLTSFTADIPQDAEAHPHFFCPNCGAEKPRPSEGVGAPEATEI